MKTKIEHIKDIPADVKYEGYVWLSDQQKPKVLRNKVYDFSTIGVNPFVVEALLWDESNKTSYHIIHTGKYHIYKYNLQDLDDGTKTKEVKYLPLGDDVKNCTFKQLWIPEEDPLCEGMPVLTMKALVFTGFNK